MTDEEVARERERLVAYIVAAFDLESGVDISHDLTAMGRVREAASALQARRAQLSEHVIDLPDLAPAASFHHTLSPGTLAVICTGEQPAPDPEAVRAARLREAREAAELAAEKEREAPQPSNVPFAIAIGILVAIAISAAWGIRSCHEHHERDHVDKAEHHK